MRSIKSENLELILFITLFAQLFCGIMLFLWGMEHRLDLATRIILTAELPLVITAFLVFGVSRLISRSEMEREREQQEMHMQLERSFQLIQGLESQRHDFRNHLQVIRTLASMGKTPEIEEYVDECGSSLNNLAGMAKVGDIILQALLLTFQSRVREMGVRFEVSCRADLSSMRCSPVKLSRVFSNILQNAAEAVSHRKVDPTISVAIWQDESRVHFIFWNNGPAIPPEDQQHIFTPGFSRKIGEHRGYGLHIVQSITEELGGSISVTSSDEEGTEFTISLPLFTAGR